MNLTDYKHFDVLHDIEAGLRTQYELHPELTDTMCVLGLENAMVAIKKKFGYAKNENVLQHPLTDGIISWCMDVGLGRIDKINNLSLKEYVAALNEVKKSVIRHSDYGVRGYYDFIRNFV